MSRWKSSMQRKVKDAIMAVAEGEVMTVDSITKAAGLGENTSPAYIALRELKREGVLSVAKGKPFQGIPDRYMRLTAVEIRANEAIRAEQTANQPPAEAVQPARAEQPKMQVVTI